MSTSVCASVCVCIWLCVHENFHEPRPCCRSIGRSRALHLCSIHTHDEREGEIESKHAKARLECCLPPPLIAPAVISLDSRGTIAVLLLLYLSSIPNKRVHTYSQPPIQVGLFGSIRIRYVTQRKCVSPPSTLLPLPLPLPVSTMPINETPSSCAAVTVPLPTTYHLNWFLCSFFGTVRALPFGSLPANQSLKISTPTRPQIASEKITTTSTTKKGERQTQKTGHDNEKKRQKKSYSTRRQRQRHGRQWQQTKRTRASIWQPRPALVCECVCMSYLWPPNTVVHLPLTPFDLFFPLLFIFLPLFIIFCAIHLRACKIRDAPTRLAFWGDEGGWLCWNSSRFTSSHHHPNDTQRCTTPAPAQPTTSSTPHTVVWLTH